MSMEDDHLKPSIGFVGMGHMGSHMAQRLLTPVTSWSCIIVRRRKPRRWDNEGRAGCPDA